MSQMIFIPKIAVHVLDVKPKNEEPVDPIVENPSQKFFLVQNSEKNLIPIQVLSTLPKIITLESPKVFENDTKIVDKIVIYVCGGGFIDSSIFSNQGFTRIWANKTDVPIFSIKYKVGPEHPFPEGLNDV